MRTAAWREWVDGLLLPSCLVCGSLEDVPSSGWLCWTCRLRWPAPLEGALRLKGGVQPVWSVWPYRGSVRRLLVRAKEELRSPAMRCFREALLAMHRARGAPPGEFVAVPPGRRRRRTGWHLAAALAAELREHAGGGRSVRLRRVEERPPQAGLSGPLRRRNLAGSFQARLAWGRSPPQQVWLVDDVMTTGSTLRECARALRGAGVRRVGALTLARVVARSGT